MKGADTMKGMGKIKDADTVWGFGKVKGGEHG